MSWANNSNFPTPYDSYAVTGLTARSELPLYECAGCGVGIYEGDTYYDLDNGDYCEDCIMNFRRLAHE